MRRLILLVSVASAVALAAPAQAKPFTYSDAKGDALVPGQAGLDITGITYATEGVTTVTKSRGKTVKTYEARKLVVTMTLAGAPMTQPGVKYRVDAQVSECGSLNFTYAPTAQDVLVNSALVVGCGGPDGAAGGNSLFLDPSISLKGNKITWSVPLKSLPKAARVGALVSQLKASVDLTEPVLATFGADDVGSALIDTAATADDWEIS